MRRRIFTFLSALSLLLFLSVELRTNDMLSQWSYRVGAAPEGAAEVLGFRAFRSEVTRAPGVVTTEQDALRGTSKVPE